VKSGSTGPKFGEGGGLIAERKYEKHGNTFGLMRDLNIETT